MAPARKRNEQDEGRASRWRPLFEALFWSALVAVAVIFVLKVYIPDAQEAEGAQRRLKAAEEELAERKESLERKRAYVRDLTRTTVDPETLERELRQKHGWKKDGEWSLRQNADVD